MNSPKLILLQKKFKWKDGLLDVMLMHHLTNKRKWKHVICPSCNWCRGRPYSCVDSSEQNKTYIKGYKEHLILKYNFSVVDDDVYFVISGLENMDIFGKKEMFYLTTHSTFGKEWMEWNVGEIRRRESQRERKLRIVPFLTFLKTQYRKIIYSFFCQLSGFISPKLNELRGHNTGMCPYRAGQVRCGYPPLKITAQHL